MKRIGAGKGFFLASSAWAVLACASPVLAADYTATDDASLRAAILDANADPDPNATIILDNDIVVSGSNWVAPTKPITIDTGNHTLTSGYNNGSTIIGAVNMNGGGNFPAGASYIFNGAIQGNTAGAAANGNGDQGLFMNVGKTVTSSAAITGGAGGGLGGNGGTGVGVTGASTFANTGTIAGGGAVNGTGGIGMSLSTGATLSNSGTMNGGDGLTGGIGVNGSNIQLVTVTNSGTIQGGKGTTGAGGDGVRFSPGNRSLTNNGTIQGGDGVVGGWGVNFTGLSTTGVLINNGTIKGGTGSAPPGGASGAGVIVHGGLGTFINTGTITGGNGGAAVTNSGGAVNLVNSGTLNAGDGYDTAILMQGTQTLTLELHKGSTINGNVVGNTGAAANSLILGGDGDDSFDVSAIGPQYQNFTAFQKTGNSTWTLTGTGTAATAWTISTGTLQMGTGSSIIGDVTNNAALAFSGSDNAIFANTITGTGAVVQAGSGTTTLTGTNTYQGGTVFNGGTLSVSDESNLGDTAGALVFNGGSLESTGNFTSARAVSLTGNGTFQTDGDLTLSHAISGNGALTKTGAGTLVLSADNTYSGGTIIGSGTLRLGDGGTTGSILGAVANNDLLVFNRAGTMTFAGAISGVGNVSQDGSGTTILTGDSSYTGTTYVTNGALQVSGGGVVNGTSYAEIGTSLAVTGAGSAFTVAGDLVTGRGAGTAAITVDNGGHLTTGRSFLGEGANHSSASAIILTVDGAGSVWNAGDFAQLSAAAGGTASLTVSHGGVMTLPGGSVAIGRGGDGVALVTGAGSQLLSGGTLEIGTSFNGGTGNGQLTIADGGQVSAWAVALSYNDGVSIGNNGTLIVRGAPGARGILRTVSLSKGFDAASATFDGGILRADGGSTDFISSYDGDYVTVGAGGMFIDTNGFDVTASSGLTGAGALTKQGAGTLILSASNGYAGGTVIENGVLQLGDGGTTGSIAGDVTGNGALVFDRSDVVTFGGAISGAGTVRQAGAGTTILTGANTYTGGATIGAGTLQIGNGGTTGSITGNVTDNAALVFNRSDAVTFSGVISGTGTVVQAGTGTATLAGANTYSGGTAITGGTLIGSAASFGTGAITDNAALVIDQAADAAFANALNGSGSFTKQGAGRLDLTGTGALSGATTVAAGTLAVNGSIAGSAATVQSGATLGGNGTVGAATIQSGAIVAPGNSIGTLHINGAFVQGAGSTYQVELDPASNASDLILVNGAATVAGGATLNAVKNPAGNYRADARYTVLTASAGVGGRYDLAGDTVVSQYLALVETQDANNIYLSVVQTGDPGTAAETPNQDATAGGVNATPPGDPVQTGVVNSPSEADARAAFDALSGEAQASAKGALVSGSLLVRDTAFDRLRDLFCAAASGDETRRRPGCATPADRPVGWIRGFGTWRHMSGTANNAGLSEATGGFLAGVDLPVNAAWRAGIFGGYSRTDFDVTARQSSGSSDNYHLGAYAGAQWGELGLKLGASYSRNTLATQRRVTFTNFVNDLQARYDAGTAQVFGELGQVVALDRVSLEPFVSLAYVNLRADGFSETGGDAALTSRADTMDSAFSTLGVRPSTVVSWGGIDATLRGMVGWRHAFGSVTPTADVSFAGGSLFTVTGAPIARDAGVVEGGADFDIAPGAAFGITYGGQFGKGEVSHGIRGMLTMTF